MNLQEARRYFDHAAQKIRWMEFFGIRFVIGPMELSLI
jgi:hypothetical protein